ncbi:MAG: hypothetical protein U0263_32130 [Polyangiaceae bacterium]
MRGLLFSVSVALGCTPATTPEPTRGNAQQPPARIEIAPARSAEPEASSKPEPPAPMAVIREPASVACRIEDRDWSFKALRIRPGGPAFMQAFDGPVKLAIAAGGPGPATAVFDDGHVVVRAVVDEKEVPLHLKAPLALRGFLIPHAHTTLHWVEGQSDKLRIAVDASSAVSWPNPVDDFVACEKLGLEVSDYLARETVTKKGQLPQRSVKDGAELAEKPGGPAVAKLAAEVAVEVVGSRGAHSKILIAEGAYVIFGWVKTKDLGSQVAAAGYGYGSGRGARGVKIHSPGATCARDLTLVVELSGERVEVGRVRKGTSYHLNTDASAERPERGKSREPSFSEITLYTTGWLELAKDAHLFVPNAELAECDAAPKPAE